MRGRRVAAAGLVALAALLVAYVSSSPARSEAATASRTIAAASTSDFRVVLTATRVHGGSAPSARVTVTTTRKVGSSWRRTGATRLAGTYFWKTLTGPRAVCRLELRTIGGATSSPRAVVRLLQSPSLGCGPQAAFALIR